MCGVIGLKYEKEVASLGETACRLLKMLEYRGYDSTGAIIQNEANQTTLLKDVGAPSQIAYKLGINRLSGHTFCGQVRWATFGAVTKENAQPHEVRCKIHVYGAHNGNVTNCLQLKDWLQSEGHSVISENDGEMVVHTIEHYFSKNLEGKNQEDPKVRIEALKEATITATSKITGSFAAVVVDPKTRYLVAIKAGSSLYIGKGNDPNGGDFFIASSDLASVLQLTKILVPIKENEFALFNHSDFSLYDLKNGKKIKHELQRSLLKVEETKLNPAFKYFMEQEIFNQIQSSQRVIELFTGGNSNVKFLKKHAKTLNSAFSEIKASVIQMAKITDQEELKCRSENFWQSTLLDPLKTITKESNSGNLNLPLSSSYSSFLKDLLDISKNESICNSSLVSLIDGLFDLETVNEIEIRLRRFVSIINKATQAGGTIYIIACGSSFHAAKTATIMFNEIAGISTISLLPGEFRGQCSKSLKANDVIIGISQSGETKDLIDIFNFVIAEHKNVKRICVLNNTNSTLALEKCDLTIPLFCGPEIAVPATKSFMNQLLVLYILAIKLDEHLSKNRNRFLNNIEDLNKIPGLIERTIKANRKEIEEISENIFLKPSIHILATRIFGVAKEGALKIREIVLNHTEGFESSEFKHGPNTILGINTIFGVDSMRILLGKFGGALSGILNDPQGRNLSGEAVARLFKSAAEWAFGDTAPSGLNDQELSLFKKMFSENNFFESLYNNYPLLFITCPGEKDVNLTISQINTHKIRGSDVFLIAEDNDALREAISKDPQNGRKYRYGYITLPRTDHQILPIFSITTALQLLAFNMSQRKMEFLDKIEIENHGVHPDAPKNVSKSITVD
ncbi:MAG: SIS domain-containing protein [Candidatus Riflebacteria bacterium]|nr:SIS domain-containing protein [Candidatus Riflebacteria bacterium]